MILEMAGDRQAPALDGIGQNGDGLAFDTFSGAQGLQDTRQIMSAQVERQLLHRLIAHLLQELGQTCIAPATPVDDDLADMRAIGPAEALILHVRAFVDPLAQPVAMGLFKEGFLGGAIFQQDDMPALGFEELARLHRPPFRGDEVEALAVEVDDPPQLIQVIDARLAEGFGDVPLVDLGISRPGRCSGPAASAESDVRHIVAPGRRKSWRRSQARRTPWSWSPDPSP